MAYNTKRAIHRVPKRPAIAQQQIQKTGVGAFSGLTLAKPKLNIKPARPSKVSTQATIERALKRKRSGY